MVNFRMELAGHKLVNDMFYHFPFEPRVGDQIEVEVERSGWKNHPSDPDTERLMATITGRRAIRAKCEEIVYRMVVEAELR